MSISCLPGREDGFLTHRGSKAGVGGGGGGGGGGSGRLGPEPRFQFPVTLPGIANLLPSSGSPWDNIGSHHRNSLDLLHSSKGGMVENIASPTAYLNRDALALQARSPVRPRKMATSPETQKEAQPLDFSTKRRKLSLATDAEDCISEDGFLNAKEDTEPPRKSPASSSKLSELDILRGSISSSRLESSRATALTHMGIGSPLSQYTNTPLSSLQAPPPPPPPPHRASPMCMAPGVNSALLAHLQANPLLLSTLQSALATSRLTGQYEPYLPSPRHTPSPANFSIPSSPHHSTLSSPNLLGINPLEASGLGSRILGMESTMEERGMKTDGLGNFLGLSACSTNPLANLNPLVGLRGLSSGVGGLRDLVDTPNNIMTPTQAEAVINAESNESYIKFRRQMLVQVSSSKGRKSQNPQSGNHEDDSRSSSDLQCESFSNRHSEKSPGFSDAENNNSVEMDVGTAGSSGMLMDRNLSDDGDSRMSGSSDINVKDCSSNPDTTDNDCSINSRSVVNNPSENSNSSNSSNRNTAVISHLNSSSHQTTDNDSNRASTSQSAENVVKDEAYWERRRKNNEAAKRSRDARRAKEDEIAIRAAFLEQENIKLRVELSSLKSETTKLRCLLYNN